MTMMKGLSTMTRFLGLAVLTLALVGCSGLEGWSRQGAQDSQVAKELDDCKSQARAATQRDNNIMSDIMATRGRDWSRTDVMSTQVNNFAAENSHRTGDIVRRCMIGKGYTPGD